MSRWAPPRILSAGLLSIAAGCGGDPGPELAQRAVAALQQALQNRDVAACRAALTEESAAALADLPWHRLDGQAPLLVQGARREGGDYLVDVLDPNQGGRRSQFVVVREYGRLVVDLVATAGLCATAVEATASETFAARELTPADLDRIRQFELTQPPR